MNNSNENNDYKRREERTHFKKRTHKKLWTFIIILLIILTAGLIYLYNAYNSAQKTFDKTFEAGDTHKLRNVSSVINKDKPFSVLLLGTDTGALGRDDMGRTDTMMVVTVNPKKENISITSIPRDTKVTVPGDSQPYEKINAAYTIGGPSTAVQTVQNLLNVPIDFYAIINMGGLEKMVNAVGGVEVNPPLTFKYGNANVVKGQKVTLNGKQALDYSRMRHEDPTGDYGRQKRQREVLQKLVLKAMKISSLPRYKEILESLNGNLKTDITFNDMVSMRARYGDATHHIKSDTLQGEDATIDGIDYQVAPENELLRVSNYIRKNLNLSSISSLSSTQSSTDDDGSGTGTTTDGTSTSTDGTTSQTYNSSSTTTGY
ncbi:LCP family protein [Lactobacillus sp. Sy-1]|uniref:LCP family protein n=1 Tax=Lactobacillus sp. Sy-1 TaxID=2109645 RepID=UPI001C5B371D|nr:LCP family protein [Lactobacillus sp. Sy-1]MBW1606013.1 LCP family protein [Lactobacillus sp. Sy-1]